MVVYTAVQRFNPSCPGWQKYIAWSGLTQLREVVSLDDVLCPNLIRELSTEDWEYNVREDYRTHLFRDLDYLLRRVGDRPANLLALMANPTEGEVGEFHDDRFAFCGFDLVDVQGGISALVNCGGFDRAFVSSDLNEFGLLADHAKAVDVQRRLREEYPGEHHAICDVWAVWRMTRKA